MTTNEIKRVLAEREGWTPEVRKRYGGDKNVSGWGKNKHLSLGDRERDFTTWLDFDINSKDAIGRVMEKLTHEEWRSLHIALQECDRRRHSEHLKYCYEYTHLLLTLPAAELARCVAEAIKK